MKSTQMLALTAALVQHSARQVLFPLNNNRFIHNA